MGKLVGMLVGNGDMAGFAVSSRPENSSFHHLPVCLSGTCEGAIGLRAVSKVEFEDDGHAIAWAMAH